MQLVKMVNKFPDWKVDPNPILNIKHFGVSKTVILREQKQNFVILYIYISTLLYSTTKPHNNFGMSKTSFAAAHLVCWHL